MDIMINKDRSLFVAVSYEICSKEKFIGVVIYFFYRSGLILVPVVSDWIVDKIMVVDLLK